jgi:hypothetical protein
MLSCPMLRTIIIRGYWLLRRHALSQYPCLLGEREDYQGGDKGLSILSKLLSEGEQKINENKSRSYYKEVSCVGAERESVVIQMGDQASEGHPTLPHPGPNPKRRSGRIHRD